MSRNSKAKRDKQTRKKKKLNVIAGRKVPFFANPDDTHCFQASIRMVLKYYKPNVNYDWDALDKLTGKKEGL